MPPRSDQPGVLYLAMAARKWLRGSHRPVLNPKETATVDPDFMECVVSPRGDYYVITM